MHTSYIVWKSYQKIKNPNNVEKLRRIASEPFVHLLSQRFIIDARSRMKEFF